MCKRTWLDVSVQWMTRRTMYWKKATCGRVKDKAVATGFAFCCSKRCDGFFNEASPRAGKWTKSVVAAAEQIGNSFVCKINYHGLLCPPLSLSLNSISIPLFILIPSFQWKSVGSHCKRILKGLSSVSGRSGTTVPVGMSRGWEKFLTDVYLKALQRRQSTAMLWLTDY